MSLTGPRSFGAMPWTVGSQALRAMELPALKLISSLPERVVPAPARLLQKQAANRGLPSVLGRVGSLEVRLARTSQDIRRAQRLRYQVFYEELAALPNVRCKFLRRDIDVWDGVCDHLLVVDNERWDIRPGRAPRPMVVGAYRLLRQGASGALGFYTAEEFDIAPLIARHPEKRFLELGRSCVLAPYRNKKTVELLWHGIWAYVRHHRIDVMIGCASLPGTDPDALASQLSFLKAAAPATGQWAARALPGRSVRMDRIEPPMIDAKAALKQLPPLVKGYLRLGACFGDGAVVDHQFGTTDVLVVLPVERIDSRYIEYYGTEGQRYAA